MLIHGFTKMKKNTSNIGRSNVYGNQELRITCMRTDFNQCMIHLTRRSLSEIEDDSNLSAYLFKTLQ